MINRRLFVLLLASVGSMQQAVEPLSGDHPTHGAGQQPEGVASEIGKPDMRLFPLLPLDGIFSTGTEWIERSRVELQVLVQVAATNGATRSKLPASGVCSIHLYIQ
jgi:hypothetical protein